MAIPTFNYRNFHSAVFSGRKGFAAAVVLFAALLVSLAVLAGTALVGSSQNGTSVAVDAGAAGFGEPAAAEAAADSGLVVATPDPEAQELAPTPALVPPPVPARSQAAPPAPAAAFGGVSGEAVAVSISGGGTVTEGGTARVTFTLPEQATERTVVRFEALDATGSGGYTATRGVDFIMSAEDPAAVQGSAVIAAGSRTGTGMIQIVADGVVEAGANETFAVLVVQVGGLAPVAGESAVFSIVDAPNDLVVTIGNAEANEGSAIVFPVTLSRTVTGEISANYTIGAGSNTTTASPASDDDFITSDTTVDLNRPGHNNEIRVRTRDDSLAEPDETFTVALTGAIIFASGVNLITTDTAVGTIKNNDAAAPAVSISDSRQPEAASFTFAVTLSVPAPQPITVKYSTGGAGDTATAGVDYTSVTDGTLTFATGARTPTQPLVVTVTDDSFGEPEESFTVTLHSPVNALLDFGSALGIIENDDTPVPYVALSGDQTQQEGATFVFTLQLVDFSGTAIPASQTLQDITVNYQVGVAADTAEKTQDYTYSYRNATNGIGSLVFSGNSTARSKQISIATIADGLPEPSETFTLRVVSVANGQPPIAAADRTATGTITDSDEPVFVLLTGSNATEGEAMAFTLELSRPISRDVTVGYTAQASPGVEFKIAGFSSGTSSGSVTIPAGATSQTLRAFITDDHLDEPDKSLTLTLTSASQYADLGASVSAAGTVYDNDRPNFLTLTAGRAKEGNAVPFTAHLSRPLNRNLTFTYATENGTATSPGDYTAVTSGSGTITAGNLRTTFSIRTSTGITQDKTFKVNLTGAAVSNPASSDAHHTVVQLGDPASAEGTIVEADGLPLLNVFIDQALSRSNYNTTSTPEGQYITARFQLSRALPSNAGQVEVGYRVTPATATAADYHAAASGTVVFDASTGELAKTFDITLLEDAADEPEEIFYVELAELSDTADNYLKWGGRAKAVATIEDIDETYVTIGDADAEEADGFLAFPVTLSGPTSQEVVVSYSTQDGTATAGSDYTATASSTVRIPAYARHTTIFVPVINNNSIEDDETLTVQLVEVQNLGNGYAPARLGRRSSAVGTIADDDTPLVTISDTRVTEGDSAVFTAKLSRWADSAVTVEYATEPVAGSANSTDYTAVTTPATVTFAPGTLTTEIKIATTEDTTSEDNASRPANDNEQFKVELLAVTTGNAELGYYTYGAGTIIDDDETARTLVTIAPDSATSSTAAEGSPIIFKVTRSSTTGRGIKVWYQTATGHGGASTADFEAKTGFVEFTGSETTKDITIPTTTDTLNEPTEKFEVVLLRTSPAKAKLGSQIAATGTITNVP